MNRTWIENLTHNNWTLNETFIQSETLFNITFASQIINVVITIVTVLLNSFMIKCLQISRSNIPGVIYGQLMSLCVSDIIAGLTTASSCLTFIDAFNRGSKFCAALAATYHTTQYAVLLNLWALSIRRWLVLRKATIPSAGTKDKLLTSIFITFSAWLTSLIFCFTRTFVTVTDKSTIDGCLSPELFPSRGAGNSVIVTYSVILILLNIFYIYSAVIIKRMDNSNSSGTRNNRQRMQKRAFMHLLAVLMVTNATSGPIVFFPIIIQVLGKKTPGIVYNVTHIQALNSMINPLLYTAHIKEIITTVKSKIFTCRRSRPGVSSVQEPPAETLNVSTAFSLSVSPLNQSD